MKKIAYFLSGTLIALSPLYSNESSAEATIIPVASKINQNLKEMTVNKNQIPFLMQKGQVAESIALYQKYREQIEQHDFEVLHQMANVLLLSGAKSGDSEKELLSIYGSGIANLTTCFEILEAGVQSKDIMSQLASIKFLAQIQDDRSEDLLNRAMSSEFLYSRMEAAYQLAMRKSKKGLGQIEALMYRLPPPFRMYFPQFFALIGTADAIAILRHLIDDPNTNVRVSSILSAAGHGRDDLLPLIRSAATHHNTAEQEACATALGMLKDSHSLTRLKALSTSPTDTVKLAALNALYSLGQKDSSKEVAAMAEEGNLFAIDLLGHMRPHDDVLKGLLTHEDKNIRLNAALSLLGQRNPHCIPAIFDVLIRDSRDLGFVPHLSPGGSLFSWKIVPSLKQHANLMPVDLYAISLYLKEKVLRDCLELDEDKFLVVASRILKTRQTELVPVLVSLLENLRTEKALAILQDNAGRPGSPLIRTYCTLALFRISQSPAHKQVLTQWISGQMKTEMIRFRPSLPMDVQLSESANFELTPEENSRLLIEAFESIADKHENESIDLLLTAIKDGHPKNQYVLAGLLLRAIQ